MSNGSSYRHPLFAEAWHTVGTTLNRSCSALPPGPSSPRTRQTIQSGFGNSSRRMFPNCIFDFCALLISAIVVADIGSTQSCRADHFHAVSGNVHMDPHLYMIICYCRTQIFDPDSTMTPVRTSIQKKNPEAQSMDRPPNNSKTSSKLISHIAPATPADMGLGQQDVQLR